jgi:DNA-binding SARP family transcriptional activator/WD40 repeat protein
MRIRVLGPLDVESQVRLEPRDRTVLSVLAVRHGQAVPPDVLADAIWGDSLPSSWHKQVQICIARLRKAIGARAIETVSGSYRLDLQGGDLDSEEFEQSIERARYFAATDEPDRAATAYARAVSLWRGRPLEDLDRWLPGRSEAARLEEIHRGAEEDRLEALLATGQHRLVAAEAEALATTEPLRERRWALLATAQYRCGRQGEALRSLQQARNWLVEELGISPSAELVDLEKRILRQDESLAAPRYEPNGFDESCPYRGLAPFDVEDAGDFFGRDDEIELCLSRLQATEMLVVTGPSGSGKSSLVRAGVVPALRAGGRPVVVIVPGTDPEAALAEAVSHSEGDAIVVVDQFEEIFALDDSADAAAFCRTVVSRTRRAPVILVVRSDHLGELGREPELSRLTERGLVLLNPLSGENLREAITRPAEQAGLRLEHGLTDLLGRDTEGEPGALPLLSHALAETWQHRDGRVLTIEGYAATGGIRGAVARTADRLYEGLPPNQRTLLRSLMLRLVSPSIEGDPVRRRLPRRALLGDAERSRIISLLVRSRLITTGEDSVELAHEALARAWPRLQSWLEEDVAGQRILRHISASADAWESLARPESDLYRGARLETALEWRDTTDHDLTDLEQQFLESSRIEAESEKRALAERTEREAHQNRRLRIMLVSGGVLLVAAIIGGVLAVLAGQEASRERDLAEAAQLEAETARMEAELEALTSQSLALRSTNRSLAALLAVEAHRREGGARAWSALLGTFTAAPGFVGYQHLPGDALTGALVPGSSTAVVALDGTELALYDLETGDLHRPFENSAQGAPWSVIDVSHDGRRVAHLALPTNTESCEASIEQLSAAQGTGCGVLTVHDVETGQTVVEPSDVSFDATATALSPDGSLVAVAGGPDGDLALYRSDDRSLVGGLPGMQRSEHPRWQGQTAAIAFSTDGSLYVGSVSGPIRRVDAMSLDVLQTIEAPALSSNLHMIANEDGTIVAGGPEGLVSLGTDGHVIWTTDLRRGNHPDPCPYFSVSARFDKVFCGNHFGVIEERDLTTGILSGSTLDPQLGAVGTLDVTADGAELVAFGVEHAAISRWRLDGAGPVTRRVADGYVDADGYEPGGGMVLVTERPALAAVQEDLGRVAVWDPEANRLGHFVDADVEGAGWVGPGLILALDIPKQEIVYYDTRSRRFVDGPEIPLEESVSTWPSAGGTRFYALLTTGEVWTFDARTRELIGPTIRVDGIPRWVSATRDGARVVVTYDTEAGPTTAVFDGETGEMIVGDLVGPSTNSVSLDGQLVGAEGGAITQYDLMTLRPIAELPGARGEVNSLQFSEDGRVLLATSNDQTVSIYDAAAWTRIGDPIPSNAPLIFPGHLRPDGGAVTVTVAEGVAVWDIDPDHLAEAACRVAGRDLTETEWETYLGSLGDYRQTCDD